MFGGGPDKVLAEFAAFCPKFGQLTGVCASDGFTAAVASKALRISVRIGTQMAGIAFIGFRFPLVWFSGAPVSGILHLVSGNCRLPSRLRQPVKTHLPFNNRALSRERPELISEIAANLPFSL